MSRETTTKTLMKEKKARKPALTANDPEAAKVTMLTTEDITLDVESQKPSSKKRKRDTASVEELEIDVNLPEPPSKKALRKAKRAKTATATAPNTDGKAEEPAKPAPETDSKTAKRSEYGIWIGNLPWTATKDSLRTFLCEHAQIKEDQITRVHIPAPKDDGASSKLKIKPQNKGFAYVDFNSPEALEAAIGVSETLMGGRRVLIKNAKSFEGRPEKNTSAENNSGGVVPVVKSGSAPTSKRIFVGNLAFDLTKEELVEHFKPCGEVVDAHMATFEDTGKCKGFAWISFAELAGSVAAVRGWTQIPVEQSDDEVDEDEEGNKPAKSHSKAKKMRKWFVNRLRGRELRCEFAEDPASRYKKRFGKGAAGRAHRDAITNGEAGEPHESTGVASTAPELEGSTRNATSDRQNEERKRGHDLRHERRKTDARTIKPGAAHTNAPRATAAIVEAQGKRTTFD